MKKITSIVFLVLLVGVFSFVFVAKNKFSTTEAQVRTPLPVRQFTFSANPFFGKGYNARPLMVTSVRSDSRTMAVDGIRVRNISSKEISEFKVGWILLNAEDRAELASKENVATLLAGSDLARKRDQIYEKTIVSFPEINDGYLEGKASGNYRLEIVVTEITFTDGTIWKTGQEVSLKKPAELRSIGNSFAGKSSRLTVTPVKISRACAHQKCVNSSEVPPSYSCGGSQEEEFCTNCSTSCCNTICGFQPMCGGCS